MIDITNKNSKFVEGVVCQIIEPDLQQTASYIRRIREKGPDKAASSLRRRQVRFSTYPLKAVVAVSVTCGRRSRLSVRGSLATHRLLRNGAVPIAVSWNMLKMCMYETGPNVNGKLVSFVLCVRGPWFCIIVGATQRTC